MGVDRREFLKITGLGAVLGLACERSLEVFAESEANFSPNGKAWTAKRWAMVIDLKKCTANDGCTDCISACHHAHNVPKVDPLRHEVKWI